MCALATLRLLSTIALLLHQTLRSGSRSSEFSLEGDYLVGGLFPLHNYPKSSRQVRPEAIDCTLNSPSLPGYQMFQVFRFTIEEINNSTTLLPNVTLGYQIFDHCSDSHSFPAIMQFFAKNGSFQAKDRLEFHIPNVIGFTGPFSSTESLTIAPFFMADLIPMVNYGASSSVLSDKIVYPSYVRTLPSNKDQVDILIHIIKHFGWNWVAFIGSETAYSQNGFQLFVQLIQNAGICLAYHAVVDDTSNMDTVFKTIESLEVSIIIVFIEQLFAEHIINSAIRLNFRNKVWLACEAWAMNALLPTLAGLRNIGTIIGVTPTVVHLPGFNQFIHQSRLNTLPAGCTSKGGCNQVCRNCSSVTAEELIKENPAYSFPVYSAVYTMAIALHRTLHCHMSGCNRNRPVYPYLLLREIKQLDVQLNGFQLTYDKNLDQPAHYTLVLWDTKHQPVKIKEVGFFHNHPYIDLFINDTQFEWYGGGSIPFSNCSVDCNPGHVRYQDGQHSCCFVCVQCKRNQYANHSVNLYSCLDCNEDEWSEAGSPSCQKRSVEYLYYSDVWSILLMISACSFILLCLGVTVLFAFHSDTPVVRSAGGAMCFLMLACLCVSSFSVFFYLGEPSALSCALQNWIFVYFFTVFCACLAVRSFQIVCIFKMATKLPKAHGLWVKHHGQQMLVAAVSLIQLVLCGVWIAVSRAVPIRDTNSFPDQLLLKCYYGQITSPGLCMALLCILTGLSFCFSYMGTDLPKNYNEAKAITFSIVLFYLSWAVFFTASLVSRSKYIQVIKASVELSCLFSVLFSYFIPKSFIIVFQPHKNTAEYFQASIQSYTQTISRM